ncbi:MAG: hypothetical protein IJO73_07445 [Clostridia bacterium]|nr:hypothetical protein [Clostridia bacterium]
MNKLAKFARKPAVKKVFGIFFSALMIFSMALPSFAAEVTPSDFSDEAVAGMKEALGHVTATLSIGTILKVIGAGLGIAVSFFLLWWGIRKLIRMVRQGFSKGKVSV